MRLLVLGTHSHGGFGVVTHELATRFLALGVDVRVIAVDHRGEPIGGPLAGRVWPASLLGGSHGTSTGTAVSGAFWKMFDATDAWVPDAVLAIEDMTGLLMRMQRMDAAWGKVPIFHYMPIEGDNLPPSWKDVWKLVHPVAMSTYGQGIMAAFTGRDVPLVYHGVDTETFRPVSFSEPIVVDGQSLSTKEACKSAFGLDPRRNLILRSDALVERKFYDRFLAAMVMVLERSPETDVLMHTTPQRDMLDLMQELHRLPEWVAGRIRITGLHDTFRGLSRPQLAALINAADLYVSTTGGEGFGLNLAEALACEVPVVVTDWAADAEVVGPGGVAVPPLHDSYGEVVRYHSAFGMDWAVPDPRAFVEPTLRLLAKPARRREMGAEGRRHVVRNFSWDTAASRFLDLFEETHASLAA